MPSHSGVCTAGGGGSLLKATSPGWAARQSTSGASARTSEGDGDADKNETSGSWANAETPLVACARDEASISVVRTVVSEFTKCARR